MFFSDDVSNTQPMKLRSVIVANLSRNILCCCTDCGDCDDDDDDAADEDADADAPDAPDAAAAAAIAIAKASEEVLTWLNIRHAEYGNVRRWMQE
jgi:hypothetical protein